MPLTPAQIPIPSLFLLGIAAKRSIHLKTKNCGFAWVVGFEESKGKMVYNRVI